MTDVAYRTEFKIWLAARTPEAVELHKEAARLDFLYTKLMNRNERDRLPEIKRKHHAIVGRLQEMFPPESTCSLRLKGRGRKKHGPYHQGIDTRADMGDGDGVTVYKVHLRGI